MTKKKAKPAAKPKSNPLPAQMFKGKRFVVAGSFYHPDKHDIASFLSSQGAEVSQAVTAKTHAVILGKGSKTVENQASKLNQKEGVNIHLVHDLIEFLGFTPERVLEIVTHRPSLKKTTRFPDWLWSTFDFEGADFSKQKIGVPGSDHHVSFYSNEMYGACFDEAKLTNFHFPYDADYSTSSFNKTKFKGIYFGSSESLSLSEVSGTGLTIRFSKKVSIDKAKIAKLDLTGLEDSKFKDLHANGFTQSTDFATAKCHFKNCSFKKNALEHTVFRDCTFEQCEFDQGTLKQLRFESCKLKNVKFKKLKCHELELGNTELSSVTFEDCNLFAVDCTTAKIKSVDLKNCKQSHLTISAKMAAKVKGLDESKRVDPLGKPSKQLANVIADSKELLVTIPAVLRGKQVVLTIDKTMYCMRFGVETARENNELVVCKGYNVSHTPAHARRGLVWLAALGAGAKPNVAKIKLKTSHCSVDRKTLAAQANEALSEMFA